MNNHEIRITGYIGSDVNEIRHDKKGRPFCRFSVGVITGKQNSVWYQVNVYGDKGQALIKYERIKKGHECFVIGQLSVQSFFSKATGKWTPSLSIFVKDFDIIFIQPKLLTSSQNKDLEAANKIDAEISDETVSDLDEAPF